MSYASMRFECPSNKGYNISFYINTYKEFLLFNLFYSDNPLKTFKKYVHNGNVEELISKDLLGFINNCRREYLTILKLTIIMNIITSN